MHLTLPTFFRPYALALVATALVALARLTASDLAGNFVPLIPFVLAVVVAAWLGGFGPGLLATIVSTLAADYLLIPTRHSLRIESLTGAVALAVFFATGVLVSLACESLHASRRRVEREQEKLRRSLAVQREMREALATSDRRKEEFMTTLAHELRNPLSSMRYAAEVLRDETSPSAAQQKARAVIGRQVAQMARLIDDLMDVARINQGVLDLRRECLDVRDVIQDAIESSRPTLDARHHQLAISLPSVAVPLDADRVRLSQVFSNLLTNAAKYTPPGGRIQVRVEAKATTVAIQVVDNGIGIPQQMLSWIFEPFAQLEQSQQHSQGGVGIGLALASRLVRMHGGRLVAYSDGLGKGSQFTVNLPVVPASTEPPPQSASDA